MNKKIIPRPRLPKRNVMIRANPQAISILLELARLGFCFFIKLERRVASMHNLIQMRSKLRAASSAYLDANCDDIPCLRFDRSMFTIDNAAIKKKIWLSSSRRNL